MASSPTEDSDLELVNLEVLAKKYAILFLNKDDKKKADYENPEINWNFMYVTHGEARYVQSTDFDQPTAHVLFTGNFVNDTPAEKTYALRTERKTKSVSNVSFKRVYTFGCSLNLKITPPSTIIGSAVGFKRDVKKEKGIAESSERELSWSVDSQIQVPAGCQTTAKLIIKESNYSGDFTIRCIFEGKVLVTYRDKETKAHIYTVSGLVEEVFKDAKEFTTDNRGRPVFEVKGVCHCKYGLEQNVTLTQSNIPPPN